MTAATNHDTCERIRMCLAEAGLDPNRMMCGEPYTRLDGSESTLCAVACGVGTEGFTAEEVDRITEKAIALANGTQP